MNLGCPPPIRAVNPNYKIVSAGQGLVIDKQRSAAALVKKMGVEKEVLRPGTGPKPVAGRNVTVHCTGFG